MADVILKAEHLKIGFFSERHSLFEKRKRNEVLKDLSFTMEKGEVLGLVGESGEENRLDYGRTASNSEKASWKRTEAEGTRNVKKSRSG